MSTPLTQAEVDALPPGTKVVITWSGGNGPHTYETAKHYDSTYTLGRRYDGTTYLAHHITFVGPEKPFTVVTLAEN